MVATSIFVCPLFALLCNRCLGQISDKTVQDVDFVVIGGAVSFLDLSGHCKSFAGPLLA